MNTQENIDRQLLEWAFAELRKEFRHQIKRFDILSAAAANADDREGYEQFTAASTAWKRALDRVIDIDIRVLITRDEMEEHQDNESNIRNKK